MFFLGPIFNISTQIVEIIEFVRLFSNLNAQGHCHYQSTQEKAPSLIRKSKQSKFQEFVKPNK